MSRLEVKLASLIIQETFGETVEKVCVMLLQKPFTPLGIIAQKLNLRQSEVIPKCSFCFIKIITIMQ